MSDIYKFTFYKKSNSLKSSFEKAKNNSFFYFVNLYIAFILYVPFNFIYCTVLV